MTPVVESKEVPPPPTKLEMYEFLMSLGDLLGFIAGFVVKTSL